MRTHRLPVTPRPIASFKRHSMALGVRLSFSTITGLLTAGQASAQAPEAGVRYDIPAGPLDEALSRFAQQSGAAIVMDAAKLRSLSSSGLRGDYGVEEGFNRLLLGSGYTLGKTKAGYIVIEAPGASQGAATVLPAVKVEAQSDRLFDPPPEQGGFKAEYQESATKTPLSIRETPQSISVVTRESMDARQVLDVSSALELSAGVSGAQSAGPFAGVSRGQLTAESFVIRGQLTNSGRDLRTDGFAGSTDAVQVDPVLYERVEYIKGPSSSLYGTGSLSGFINRVSKKPKAERELRLAQSVGSFDTYRTEFDLTGALDQDQRYAGRLIGLYEDSGSFVDFTDRKTLLLAPSVSADIAEKTRLLVQAYYQDRSAAPQFGLPAVLNDDGKFVLPRVPRSRYFGVIGEGIERRYESEEYRLSVRADHEINDRWLATLLLQGGRTNSTSVVDGYAYGFYDGGDNILYDQNLKAETDTWSGELRLDGRFDLFGRTHQVLVGFEQRNLDSDTPRANFTPAGTGNLYTGEFDYEPGNVVERSGFVNTRFRAAFTQFIFGLDARTRLIAGTRHENAERRALSLPGSGIAQEADKGATTYRVALSRDLTTNLTGFAAYATSFIPVVERGPSGEVLDPETGTGLEFGLKGEWFDKKLGASLAVFRQERDKVPLSLTRAECEAGGAGLTSCARSAGEQEFEGIELELSGTPLPGLTIGLAASWLDGTFTERSDPNFGRPAPNVVERQTNAYINYKLQSGPLTGLGTGLSIISVGDMNGVRVGQVGAGYERADLHFGYGGLKNWDFTLLVRNLFDQRYIERFFSQQYLNYAGSPTAALLRVEYRFDL